MKKLLLIALALLMSAETFADNGQINLKIGAQLLSFYHFNNEEFQIGTTEDKYTKSKNAISIGTEYLRVLSPVTKIGAGIQYAFERNLYANKDNSHKISNMPIYAIIQINPLKNFKQIHFLFTIGADIFFFRKYGENPVIPFGSLYNGIGIGYEFPCGLFAQTLYNVSFINHKNDEDKDYIDIYDEFVFNIGYKFKI
ncbi:MAG: hypothetical protein LBT79_00125 [Elusimicrobiota bacterium]|jgi:hypothetical protein|nr:hypothetical protein [Elusimicrobiota bacterium]